MVFDLTLQMSDQTPVFPTLPGYSAEEVLTRSDDGVVANKISMATHIGTHIDAPFHFFPEGTTIDGFHLDLFIGSASVLDLHHRSGSVITREDLEEASRALEIANRVLILTGDVDEWFGDDFFDRSASLSTGAAQWLVEAGVELIGVDFLTEAVPGNPTRPVHKTLLGNDIPIVENLCNTETIGDEDVVEFICPPLFLTGLDAAPTRALARPMS